MQTRRNVPYKTVGDLTLYADMFTPDVGYPWKTVIFVHGGGWVQGTRTTGDFLAEILIPANYALVTVDYRMSGTALFPAAVDDVKDAVLAVLARPRYNPVALFGASAGAHLAALAGLAMPEVLGVVYLFGVSDTDTAYDDAVSDPLTAPNVGPTEDEPLVWFLGCNPEVDCTPETIAASSPVDQVRNLPFLILHGDQDRLSPIRQSERLRDALLAIGAAPTYRVVPGRGHDLRGITQDSTAELLSFLEAL